MEFLVTKFWYLAFSDGTWKSLFWISLLEETM